VLEERQYRPLGEGAGDRVADVRFIVGTNANLLDAVRERRFREDLYYRVNVLPVRIPSLDERRDEIGAWAAFMLERRHRASVPDGSAHLAVDAIELLAHSNWPGNLRQLDNVVRRSYALALTEVEAASTMMTLRGRHVERALALESGTSVRPLLDLLHQAATAFVLEATRRQHTGEVLDLDHADALRALVLGAAIQKAGSIEEAFRLVGKFATVQNRNHRKVLRAEFKRLEALAHSLGQADVPIVAGLLGGDGD
jgi:DNA-binding NtrC family response regulator